MSHKATTWAIQQRGLKPAAKIVLWHLCDRYHPDNGCYPSQDTLAHDCEMARSTLNLHLKALEKAGLIRREVRRDEATNRHKSTRYRLAFEDDFKTPVTAKPCPDIGHGAVSEKRAKPCPKNAQSRVREFGHKPVIEPVSEPFRARDQFDFGLKAWPSGFADSRADALKAWDELSDSDQVAALDEITRYVELSRSLGREHLCSFAKYLRERRWEALPDRPRRKPSDEPSEVPNSPKPKPTAFQLAYPHLYPELFPDGPPKGGAGQSRAEQKHGPLPLIRAQKSTNKYRKPTQTGGRVESQEVP